MSVAYIFIFLLLLIAGAPIVFALLIGPGLSLALDDQHQFYPAILARLYNGIDSFPLMAVPFFILAGELMNSGGVTAAIFRFAKAMIGHVRGGLAQVNIVTSMLFASLSGSAVADASAVGKMLVPEMVKEGYSRRYSAAVTAAAAILGPVIPPSGLMILYAFVMNVSVAALFAAGAVVGVLMAGGLMLVTMALAHRRGFPKAEREATWSERGKALTQTLPALMTPVVLLGGVLSGAFTPTEAAAVACVYALVVGIFIMRTLKVADLPRVFVTSAAQSGVVLLLVGAAVSFAWIVTVSGLAESLAALLTGVTTDVYLLLLLVNLLLFIVGMFLDAGPAILILGPVLGPMFVALGVDPLHFAVVMCVNVTVGLATPPMGLVLFVASSVSGEKPAAIALEMAPYLLMHASIIFLITYAPAIVTTLPRMLGFA
ncbi:MAG TPA: C4-dicarboxylate ABC transporter permease [Parvularcula sp.]|nr:C4-dicarboxylate ABC transporter permease [Parvularcula sp.]